MNLFELIFLILCIICGLFVGNWFWHHFGLIYSPIGFLVGFFAIIGGLKLLQLWLEFWHKLFPLRPICQENKCLSDNYEWQNDNTEGQVFKCECKVLYVKDGKRFLRILPDNSLSPYMKRSFLRIWKRDEAKK